VSEGAQTAGSLEAASRRVYLQPVLRTRGCAPPGANSVLAVKGTALAFAAAVLIERDGTRVRRVITSAADLATRGLVSPELLARLSAPLADVAGGGSDRPRLVGVINVTPDSFSDGGRYLTAEAAIAHGLRLAEEGADILDIGGESTRPGSKPIDVAAELARVLPVIEGLHGKTRARLSIDTRHAQIMRRAAQAGVDLINDVSALTHDPASLATAAATGLPVVLMHSQGTPETMQLNPTYDDVVLDVYDALERRILACEAAGIARARLIVDPGIGFGKTLAHNLALLGALSIFHGLGCAVMLGASRKSFIGQLCGAEAAERLPGSLAAALMGLESGVEFLRVHDVAATRQAIAVWEGVRGAACRQS
jgi:dihydropteroate synthase